MNDAPNSQYARVARNRVTSIRNGNAPERTFAMNMLRQRYGIR